MTFHVLLADSGDVVNGSPTAGTIGAVFFGLMALASFLLWWNMDRRLKRLSQREAAEVEAAQKLEAEPDRPQ